MKKFMKFILWLVAICGAAIGAMYFIKNVLMKDYLDDYDEDFDNDLYDEDDEDDEDNADRQAHRLSGLPVRALRLLRALCGRSALLRRLLRGRRSSTLGLACASLCLLRHCDELLLHCMAPKHHTTLSKTAIIRPPYILCLLPSSNC